MDEGVPLLGSLANTDYQPACQASSSDCEYIANRQDVVCKVSEDRETGSFAAPR